MRGVAVIVKSPRPTSGRIGRLQAQDWYQSCVLAARLTVDSENAFVFVASAFKAGGDLEDYGGVLAARGCCPVPIPMGWETCSQIDAVLLSARLRGITELHVVSTWLHTLRVRWYMRRSKINIIHHIAFVIPRPWEAVTDVILTFGAPIIDILGLRDRFLARMEARRKSGKL